MSEQTRWSITITPRGQESEANIYSFAPDVTVGEVVHHIAKALALLSYPAGLGKRIPTVEEVEQMAKRQALLRDHPATRLFVKDGKQLWLGEEALEAGVVGAEGGTDEEDSVVPLRDLLSEKGWVDAGPAPEGVARACDYFQDPEATLERL